MSFVPLHTHSCYSILDGMILPQSIKDSRGNMIREGLDEWARSHNVPAVAITDHGSVAGLIEGYLGCKKVGVKFIHGCEFYIAPDHKKRENFESPSGRQMRGGYHLSIWAKNLKGYLNLIKLNNLASLDGFYYRPRIDFELLTKYREGLIVGSACPSGELAQYALSSKDPKIVAKKFKEVFGDDYYIEYMDNFMRIDLQRNINKRTVGVAKSLGIKIIATCDAHYVNEMDQEIHDVAICLQTKKKLDDPNRLRYDGNYHLRSPEEMMKVFPAEYVRNTLEIGEKVENFSPLSEQLYIPETAQNPFEILKMMAEGGLMNRGLSGTAYTERLNKELSAIKKMNLSNYLLTTRKIIDIIKSVNCPLGWGRGSSGGSLVCYCLGIVEIDPMKYGLHFERFINEHRQDWPDIDIDVAQNKRNEVIQKIIESYGSDNVAHISNYSALRPKMLVRDICRTLDEPTEVANRLSRMIPDGVSSYEDLQDGELEKHLQSHERGRYVLKILKGLMGMPRHVSVHASGIIISSIPVTENLPIRRDHDRNVIQFSMHHIADCGFLKMDILGLKTLDLIAQTAKESGIDIKDIPENDPKVFALIHNGKVDGVFQLDASKTCIDLCKRMKPKNIEEIADLIALHRPGTMDAGLLEVYVNRRNGIESVTYAHPDLKQVLERTFGVCIYQEDMMTIAKIFAGFTLGEAEDLRYGIAKKLPKNVETMNRLFQERSKQLNRSQEDIDKIMKQIQASSRYSFNKSHSVSYAHTAYACAYLSVYHSLPFFKNLINLASEDEKTDYLSAALMRKIKILPPDINLSDKVVTIEGEAIRLGLLSMKGIGDAHATKIIAKRPYKSMKQVLTNVGKSSVAVLYSANAFGSIPDADTYSSLAKADEAQILGISLSDMVGQYQDVVDGIKATSFADVQSAGTCVIRVTDARVITDRRSRKMCFVEGIDIFGPKVESLVMFADAYADEGNEKPKKDTVYAMVLSRLSNGNLQIKYMNSVESTRKQMKESAAKRS